MVPFDKNLPRTQRETKKKKNYLISHESQDEWNECINVSIFVWAGCV